MNPERVRKVAYRIALPPSLANLHDVFHASQLRKIEGREVKKLRNQRDRIGEGSMGRTR
ncbi:hypothetical protein A2U01_0049039, partial [Trifolium medium]|nr:hypothetical protein [Trifolium medium]